MKQLNIGDIKAQILSHSGISVIASRPGFGKTALSLQIAYEFSQIENIRVVYFSLEEDSKQIKTRLRTMGLSKESIYIFDPFDLEEMDILHEISPNKKTVVIIDYYQLLNCSLKLNLPGIIMDQNVHLILNYQLPRDICDLPQGKPTIDYYKKLAEREPLCPYEQANIIAFLWGQHKCFRGIGYAHEFDISDDREIIIAKNDFGENGIIKSNWNSKEMLYKFSAE